MTRDNPLGKNHCGAGTNSEHVVGRAVTLCFSFLCLIFLSLPASAGDRVALVIGNAAYKNVPELANPRNDASDMTARLKALDFEVVTGSDLDLRGVRQKINEFVDKLGTAEVALFYYAGHGLQVNGTNYLVPVDASLKSSLDLEFEAVPIQLVLSAMEDKVETNVLFLDACRDNPLARTLARSLGKRSSSIGRGLARLGAGRGTLISFATQPGNVALDGNTRNSPFTSALVKHLGTPGDSLTDSMIRVRNEVIKTTKGRQVPWEHSSLTGRVVLKSKPKEIAPPVAKAPANPGEHADITVELAFWDAVKSADSAVYFQTYLARYPGGLFADIAKLKIAEIENRKAELALQKKPELKPSPTEAPTVTQPIAKADPESEKPSAQKKVALLKPDDPEPKIEVESPELALAEREEVRELQEKLYALNFDPGTADGVAGRRTREAITAFEASKNMKKTGEATRGLLATVRAARVPDNWGALGFLASRKRVYERSRLASRKDAETEIGKVCRGCDAILVFSGEECGALAMSTRGWGWAVRKGRADVEVAAMDACGQYGSGCKIETVSCANGS